MAATKKPKKWQQTVYFDEDVSAALRKQLKVSKNANISAVVNDGLRYAMFPEHRNDRDADLVKIYHQLSSSLGEHRKKTARDMAFVQEMILLFSKIFFMHTNPVPEKESAGREAQANARLDKFMEEIVRGMSDLKPFSERESPRG